MRRRFAVVLVSVAAGFAATAAVALAGAPNYVCRFGNLRIVADVHLKAGFLQERRAAGVVAVAVPGYASGGGGFTAVRGDERLEVRLLDGGTGSLLHNASSELVRSSESSEQVRRGRCSAITGDHHAGWVTSEASVRTAPDREAPRVADAGPLPFVWALPGSTSKPRADGWVAVRLWRANGRHVDAFVPRADVRLAPGTAPGR